MMMVEADWWDCSYHNGKIEASFERLDLWMKLAKSPLSHQ